MSNSITGKIKSIGETKSYGANGFKKRTVVITTSEQYPQTVQLEFHSGNCDLLNNQSVGNDVKIDFGIQGREWRDPNNSEAETVYFNTIVGWKIASV
jgi:hypothetical protein